MDIRAPSQIQTEPNFVLRDEEERLRQGVKVSVIVLLLLVERRESSRTDYGTYTVELNTLITDGLYVQTQNRSIKNGDRVLVSIQTCSGLSNMCISKHSVQARV